MLRGRRFFSSAIVSSASLNCAIHVEPIAFVNRFDWIDSKFALDILNFVGENIFMDEPSEIADEKLQILVLERRDPSRNMARFYVLAIEPTLFGDSALVREWGRIGCRGRRRLDLHADEAGAAEALEVWLDRKVRRGYQLRLANAAVKKFRIDSR